MALEVVPEIIGKKLFRMLISHDGALIGEYERSQEADIERKKAEIQCALGILLDVSRKHGQFVVRWDGKRRVKSVRVDGIEVAQVPTKCWRKPSWEA